MSANGMLKCSNCSEVRLHVDGLCTGCVPVSDRKRMEFERELAEVIKKARNAYTGEELGYAYKERQAFIAKWGPK